ncbi:MAG: hypothetical protein GEU79_19420 [Acidimicrobiia bacterium]|nr:hypothetical protein [Acidimicrobiia bacterium]
MRSGASTRIIAHRGVSAVEAENTMRAFHTAASHGADMVEADIHLSSDGHPVVHHDSSLLHGDDEVPLASLDRDTLTGLQPETSIPTLHELLSWAQDKVSVYLDLKAPGAGTAAMSLVKTFDMTNQVIAGSFDPNLIAESRDALPEVETSILVGLPQPGEMLELANDIGTDYAHPCWENAHSTPSHLLGGDFLEDARRSGVGIVTWQEDRPSELDALLALGVDAICTNEPDRLYALREACY